MTTDQDGAPARPLPLDGILVADFSRVLAGPMATMTLADLGARVIKVERPGSGDDTRAWGPPWSAHGATYYESINRSKESVALDLTDPGDLVLARELARRADVLIHNFKPGSLERLGLGYDEVRQDNPGVVYCAVNGFGDKRGAHLLGYDFVVQAVGGLMSMTGPPGEPTKVGVALVDVLAGKDATLGILAALYAREHTGHGDRIEVSLLTSSLAAMVNQGQGALETGSAPRGMGNQHPSIAPYETLRARDSLLAVACGNDAQFARLAGVLGAPGLAQDARFATNADRVAHRTELVDVLEGHLEREDADQWVDLLTEAQVPAGRVNSVLEGIALAERLGLEPLLDMGATRAPQIRHPVSWRAYRTALPSAPPGLGEHDRAVRAWLTASRDEPPPAPTP